jgi:threonine synthase
MYVSHLECPKYKVNYDAEKFIQLCKECGAPLLVRYDLEAVKAAMTKEEMTLSIRQMGCAVAVTDEDILKDQAELAPKRDCLFVQKERRLLLPLRNLLLPAGLNRKKLLCC